MFMFWSKRAVLTRRLLKAKVRRDYETECETQTVDTPRISKSTGVITELTAGCTRSNCTKTSKPTDTTNSQSTPVTSGDCDCCVNSDSSIINTTGVIVSDSTIGKSNSGGSCIRSTASRIQQACCGGGGGRQEDSADNDTDGYAADDDEHDGRVTRCKELLKTLKENQLEMLLTSVESYGADLGPCVLIARRSLQSSHQDVEQQDHYRRHRYTQRNARSHHPLRHRHSHHSARQRSRCRHCEMRHGVASVNEDDDDTAQVVSDDQRNLSIVNVLPPPANLLSCQMWRWPDLSNSTELKKLPVCHSAKDSSYVCCNPYHWSRLCKPESPPPPYCLIPSARVAKQEGAIQSSPMDSRGNTAEPSRLPDSLTTDGEERNEAEKKEWCTLAYWELGGRVGRLYPVEASTISVFDSLHDGDGLCLASLAENHGSSAAVRRTRSKIGLGLMLSQEADGVWAYNRSDSPIFVNSPTLDDPESRTLLVYRVPPGFCLNIFDRAKRPTVRLAYDPLNSTGPVDANSVRISFAKGWGPKYSRQEVTSCPCWLEVLLAPCR